MSGLGEGGRTRGHDEIWVRLRRAAARLAIDQQASEELPMLAADALAEGVDSPALRDAAGTPVSEVRDARDRFVAALAELEIPVPDKQAGLYAIVRDCACAIVDGEISPSEGAVRIWTLRYQVEREGDLRIFVGLVSELEDNPDRWPEINDSIIEEATVLLGRSELRPWVKVMACEGAWPLWDPGSNRNLEPDELSLSSRLRVDVGKWAKSYDKVRRRPGRGPSGFATSADARAHDARGVDLVRRLQDELGDGWHVEYMPTATAFP